MEVQVVSIKYKVLGWPFTNDWHISFELTTGKKGPVRPALYLILNT